MFLLITALHIGLARADAHHLGEVEYKDFSIADAFGLGCALDGFDRALNHVIIDGEVDFDFWQKAYCVFSAAINFGLTLLAAEPLLR